MPSGKILVAALTATLLVAVLLLFRGGAPGAPPAAPVAPPTIVEPGAFTVVAGFPRIAGDAPAGAALTVRVTDWNGVPLGTARTVAADAAPGYAVAPYVSYPGTDLGWIEAETDAGKARTQVSFARASREVLLFFPNDVLDPSVSCEKVFPVTRPVFAEQGTEEGSPRAAVEELLRGPTSPEEREGFGTALPKDVAVRAADVADGVARVVFDAALDADVAGSCRVGLIRRQIEETVKAATGAREVVIEIEGKGPEEVLQP